MLKASILFASLALMGETASLSREGDVSKIIPKNHSGCDWVSVEGGGVWSGLVQDGKQIGAFNTESHEYYSIDPLSGAWVKGSERVYHREDARAAIQLRNNPGVDWQRTQSEQRGYRLGSRHVSEAQAFAALKPSPKLPDDSALPSLTLIGTVAECKAVEDELARSMQLKSLRGQFLVQSYRPGDAMVGRYGFVSGGQPTIYFTDAKGAVIWRADGDPGADTLAEAVAAGVEQCCPPRKPHPDYQPEKDPPPERVIRKAQSWGWILWTVAGVLLAATVAIGAGILLMVSLGLVVRWMRSPGPVAPVPAAVVVPATPPAAGGS